MRKELTLKELQIESLNILKDVHDFCVNNGILYSVAYGTLIGAIRHHGFIPWDDDVDIIMPRDHYIRFCKTYSSKRYNLKSRLNDKDCYLAFARVYDDRSTVIETVIPWCKEKNGVWIDVFPADFVSDDERSFRKHKFDLWRRWKAITIARAATVNFDSCKPILFSVRLMIKKVITINGRITRMLLDSFIKKAAAVTVQSSNHWSQLTCMDGYEWHKTASFSDTVLMKFEDTEVMVMNGYDEVLRECYGDYMKLPPVEEQVGHSDGLTKFYWK